MKPSQKVTIIFPKDPTYVPPPGTPSKPTGFEPILPEGMTQDEALQLAVEKMALERHLTACAAADVLERNPQDALDKAKEQLKRFKAPTLGIQRVSDTWLDIIDNWSVPQICAFLRDKTQTDDPVHLSFPFFGRFPEGVWDEINQAVDALTLEKIPKN